MVLPQNLVDVINVLGNAKLFVEVADLDGRELLLDPRMEAENVLCPPVGRLLGQLDFLLQRFDEFWVRVLVLLDLGLQRSLLLLERRQLFQQLCPFVTLLAAFGGFFQCRLNNKNHVLLVRM